MRAVPVSVERARRSEATAAMVRLGEDDRLTVTGDPWIEPADAEVASLFDRLRDVGRIAETALAGPDRRAVLEVVFGGLATALDYAEGRAADRALVTARLRASLEDATARLTASDRRHALQRYVEGMLLGLVVVLVAAGGARLGLIYVIRDTVPGTMLFPTVLVAGAFGGVLSVLTRITQGRIAVPTGGRDREIRLLGLLRPVVGVVFGTAVAVLVLSDILPVKLPGGDLRPFWVVGLAFVAGFLERFAQEFPAGRRGAG